MGRANCFALQLSMNFPYTTIMPEPPEERKRFRADICQDHLDETGVDGSVREAHTKAMFETGDTVVSSYGVEYVVTRPGSVVTGVVLHPREGYAHPQSEQFLPTASLVLG